MTAASLFDPSRRAPRIEHRLDTSPGLYAIFLAPGAQLPGLDPPNEALIYIGKADGAGGLRKRCHFNGGTRNHSPRKSLAAILRSTLRLIPKPVLNKSTGTYKTWQLEPACERTLDGWMRDNLLLSVHITAGADSLEGPLIKEYAPVLNLTECLQCDQHRYVSTLRAEIVAEMRVMANTGK